MSYLNGSVSVKCRDLQHGKIWHVVTDRASPEKSGASSASPAGFDLQSGSTRRSPASGKPDTNRVGHRSQPRWNGKGVPLGYHLLSRWPWKIRSQRWGSASPTNTNTLQARDSWIKVLWAREKVAPWHSRWRHFYCRTTLWCPGIQSQRSYGLRHSASSTSNDLSSATSCVFCLVQSRWKWKAMYAGIKDRM